MTNLIPQEQSKFNPSQGLSEDRNEEENKMGQEKESRQLKNSIATNRSISLTGQLWLQVPSGLAHQNPRARHSRYR